MTIFNKIHSTWISIFLEIPNVLRKPEYFRESRKFQNPISIPKNIPVSVTTRSCTFLLLILLKHFLRLKKCSIIESFFNHNYKIILITIMKLNNRSCNLHKIKISKDWQSFQLIGNFVSNKVVLEFGREGSCAPPVAGGESGNNRVAIT